MAPLPNSLHGAGRQLLNRRETGAFAMSDAETLTRTCANSDSDISGSSSFDKPFDEAISSAQSLMLGWKWRESGEPASKGVMRRARMGQKWTCKLLIR